MSFPSSLRHPILAAVALAALGAVAPPPAAADYDKPERRAIETQAPAYRDFLLEVELIITKEELAAFLALEKDYQRDAFIKRFWQIRDPFPDTARNEFKVRWEERQAEVRARFEDLKEDRARILLLNGPPDAVADVRCTPWLYHTEVWYYAGSDQIRRQFFLVFSQLQGFPRYRLWRPMDGLGALADPLGNNRGEISLRRISLECKDGEKLAAALSWAINDPIGFDQLVYRIEKTPEIAGGEEWIATFDAYSTDLPEDVATLPAEVSVSYPGRRHSRTVVQAVVTVPVAAATLIELAGARSYDFLVTGEVLADGELFENFRYKFDLPAAEVAGESIPLVLERSLRPGDYRLVLKLEDVNGKRFFRDERGLTVPEVAELMAPPPPSDPETARLLAEANAALAAGTTALRIVAPKAELLTGYVRFDTLATGADIAQVVFRLDGVDVLAKKRPPFSVDLDLGSLPRTRTLAAVALAADGSELARDEFTVNSGGQRFDVRLVEPRRGRAYTGSLRARAEVNLPEGQAVERVEFYLNETRLATLYQEPWEQPIVLPADLPLAYVRAVAVLTDGNQTEDLVFVNAPEYLEEVDVQFVELYASVADRDGRPAEGLAEGDFRVVEDAVPQSIVRFEKVTDLPIWAGILLDVSASMDASLPAARDAAVAFFQQTIQPKDRAAVITFNDRPTLAAKFTNDVTALAGGLAGIKAERGTALYDSLIFALFAFNGVKGQRALLVLSDGKDENSRFTYEQALEYSRRAGVTIYTVALDDAVHKKLVKIAEATGGRSYRIDSVAELAPIYEAIQRELRSQYLVAYQSTNTTGATDFRKVDLTVARPGTEVKTIQGYYP